MSVATYQYLKDLRNKMQKETLEKNLTQAQLRQIIHEAITELDDFIDTLEIN